jgi:hypothetical protein
LDGLFFNIYNYITYLLKGEQMKTSTFILSYVITFIIIVALCVSGAVCQQKKDAQIYNNGVHAIDGGTWIYKDTSGRYGGYYTFECSKCGEFVTLCGSMESEK